MTYSERKEKEKYLLYLIEQERLCCLDEAANKLDCSTRTLERIIKDLREEGNNIVFCRKSSKYFIKT